MATPASPTARPEVCAAREAEPLLETGDRLNRDEMVVSTSARKEAHVATGDVVSLHPEDDGRILLIRLERPKEPAPSQ